jgi:probable rRNA maturation factor
MNTIAQSSPLRIEVGDTQKCLDVDHDALRRLVRNVLTAEGITHADLSIVLVDDPTIHAINRRHLAHDWPTDVVTFPLSDPSDPELAGELVVSTETAVAMARRAGVDPWAELALYVVHGLLHLLGYDDQLDADRERIRRREGELLAREGLANTFPLAGLGEASTGERETARWV